MYNNRQSYKHESLNYYLFFVDGPGIIGPTRWIIEEELGTMNYGFVRYEGDDQCPACAGQKWSQVYNMEIVDPNIKINCAGKYIF